MVRGANVPDATLTALAVGQVGASDRNYPFFAPDFDLKPFGFVLEEFSIEGKANIHDTPAPNGGTGENTAATPSANVVTPDVPYKSRIIVVRPESAAKFNGTHTASHESVETSNTFLATWASRARLSSVSCSASSGRWSVRHRSTCRRARFFARRAEDRRPRREPADGVGIARGAWRGRHAAVERRCQRAGSLAMAGLRDAKVLYWGDANTQGSPPPTVRVGTRLNSVRAYGRGATAFAPAALGQ